jgi:hypothetical protein
MDRRLALVALWAAFAAAAVGVGFGAAGLVGDPFTDGVSGASPAASSATGGPTAGSSSPSGSAEPTETGSDAASPSPSRSSSTPRATSTPQPSRTGGTGGGGDGAVRRSFTTRAGFVSATCRSGVVSLSASPHVGWQIDQLDPGPDHDARVRFEPSGDGDGRVEVRVSCRAGVPRFSVDDDSSGHGGSGSDD